ncbi:MAG: hypothetical protein C0477_20665 [Delftia sp.]|nr:hypothetical protein [Delftia sp.]
MTWNLPLSGCAASPSLASREGDDTLGAGRRGRLRPFLGVPDLGLRQFHRPRASSRTMKAETLSEEDAKPHAFSIT